MTPITSPEQLENFQGGFFRDSTGRLGFKPKGKIKSSAQ